MSLRMSILKFRAFTVTRKSKAEWNCWFDTCRPIPSTSQPESTSTPLGYIAGVDLYDNQGRIIAEYDGSGNLQQDLVYLPNETGPLAAIDASGNFYLWQYDRLGSTVALSGGPVGSPALISNWYAQPDYGTTDLLTAGSPSAMPATSSTRRPASTRPRRATTIPASAASSPPTPAASRAASISTSTPRTIRSTIPIRAGCAPRSDAGTLIQATSSLPRRLRRLLQHRRRPPPTLRNCRRPVREA